MEIPHPVTNVRKCTSSNAKTLALQHLKLPDVGASVGPPDSTKAVRRWRDELLITELRS